MKNDQAKRGHDTLAGDFALIGEAIIDAFRGLPALSECDCGRTKIHYAGMR